MYARHNLAWLSDRGWLAAIDALPATAPEMHRQALAQWRRHDWPLVVRRRDADAAGDDICLGLALPPDPASGHKTRIGLRVARGDVARVAPPLSLAELTGLASLAAPASSLAPDYSPDSACTMAHMSHMATLSRAMDGLPLRVYGSLALQALTGQQYLTPRSDIDLLFSPSGLAQLEQGLRQLHTQAAAMPLDGEILFPCGAAVAWKEWLHATASGARVLVKQLDTVRLERPQTLLATLERC